jgi:hypothetical protein
MGYVSSLLFKSTFIMCEYPIRQANQLPSTIIAMIIANSRQSLHISAFRRLQKAASPSTSTTSEDFLVLCR